MTAANWPNCFKLTIGSEGGYDRHTEDRGNWTSGQIGVGELKGTKYGIAAMAYPNLDIKNLTIEDARDIYKRDYWPKVAGDQQPEGVDLVVWDIGVNSGPGRAIAIEAKALKSDIKTATGLAALARTLPDKVPVIQQMCALRASFYRSLKTFGTFGKGWLARNAKMEANGVRMAINAQGAAPSEQKKRLEKEAADAKAKSAGNGKAAGGTTAGGGVAGGATDWTSHDWLVLGGKIALAAAALIAVVYFIHWWRAHKARSEAYAAVAAATGG